MLEPHNIPRFLIPWQSTITHVSGLPGRALEYMFLVVCLSIRTCVSRCLVEYSTENQSTCFWCSVEAPEHVFLVGWWSTRKHVSGVLLEHQNMCFSLAGGVPEYMFLVFCWSTRTCVSRWLVEYQNTCFWCSVGTPEHVFLVAWWCTRTRFSVPLAEHLNNFCGSMVGRHVTCFWYPGRAP